MKTVLFQGDSITDADRNRDRDGHLGYGYALLVGSELMRSHPGEVYCLNRGKGGDRITDVYTRIKEDIINLKPDYLTLLIGFNDVSHELTMQCGLSTEKFEMIYCMLIEEIKAALPDIKIIILEPFVLKGPSTVRLWEAFDREVKKNADVAKRVAEKYGLSFVALQEKFDAACKLADTAWWSGDGIHPSFAGHRLIAEELLPVINALL